MKLIPDWRHAWRYYSVWLYAVILTLPELYQTLTTSQLLHEVPQSFVWVLRGAAILGLLLRFVDQKRPAANEAGGD